MHQIIRKYFNSQYFVLITILLISALPFLHTIFFSFSPLDDAVLILGRMQWLQNYNNIHSILTEPLYAGIGNYYYRPILILTFMLDAITGNGSPISFHISNVVYHVISSLLVYEVLKKFDLSSVVALLGTLFFVLHPVNISAISWIPGRNDTLLTIFILSSFLFWITYLKSAEYKYLLLHLLFYSLALLTKENAIVLPILSIIYYYLFSPKSLKSQIIRILIIWSIITISWVVIRSVILSNPQSISVQSFFQIILDLIIIFCLSVGKLILPINQAIAPNLLDINPVYPALITITFAFVLIMMGFRNKNIALFGFLWAVGFALLPELWVTIFNIGYSYEHRLYLPLIGFIIFISQVRLPIKFLLAPKRIIILVVILIISYGVKSIKRSFSYKNYQNFSISLLKESPSMPFAYKFRGDVLYHFQEFDEAEFYYDRSLEMSPYQTEVYFNRGSINLRSGKDSLAIIDFTTAIEIDSSYHSAYFSLGAIYAKMDNHDMAIQVFSNAINICNTDPNYFFERGSQYMKTNDYDLAVNDFTESILLDPTFTAAYHNRSVCKYAFGDYEGSLLDLLEVETLGGEVVISLLDSIKYKLQIQ